MFDYLPLLQMEWSFVTLQFIQFNSRPNKKPIKYPSVQNSPEEPLNGVTSSQWMNS